jgi:hypothetical protein
MRPRTAAAIVVAGIVSAVPALAGARTSTTTSKGLAAARAPVASCGSLAGVVANFTLSGTNATAVVLSSIPTTCNGGSLTVNVTNSASSLAAGGPVTVTSGAATVPLGAAVATGSITNVRIVVVGP